MSLVLDCLSIVEPGHHASRAAQTFEQAQEESAALRELARADAQREEAARATARRAYAFRSSGYVGKEATLAQKRTEMCRCCTVRAAVGDGGLCARRLCREVNDLLASSRVSSREGRKAKKKAKRGAPMTARARREAELMDAAVARHKARNA
jgi:hypothetical protein